jgi:hypothetical protein
MKFRKFSTAVITAAVAATALAGVSAPAQATPDATIRGAGAWVSVSGKTADQIATLSSPNYVGWISAYARLDKVNPAPGVYNWSGFDAAAQAAQRTGKPFAIMVILGTVGNGMPKHMVAGLKSDEMLSIDGRGQFPAFYSRTFQTRLTAFRTALANRYGTNPDLGMVRVTMPWSTHGEPWFEGGPAGRAQWTQKWQQFTRGGTYESLRAAYNQAELAAFDEMARLFPARVNLSMATGWAFNDQCTGSNAGLWANPSCHPQRLATWTAVRAKYGNRAVFQENGAGDPENNGNFDGARGFGAWLADSFGPNGVVPGVIGAQQVAGVVKKDGRMDADRFVRMVQVEGYRSRFLEVYETDLAYLNAGATDDARAMRNALQDATWR